MVQISKEMWLNAKKASEKELENASFILEIQTELLAIINKNLEQFPEDIPKGVG